jgi:nitric oxide synthase oxygenase domain/subunit
LVEKKKIDEIRKEKMTKMVEDMLVKKSKDSDVNKKNQSLSKLLTKNLESIKKIAEKEGISISDLIKVLKKSE